MAAGVVLSCTTPLYPSGRTDSFLENAVLHRWSLPTTICDIYIGEINDPKFKWVGGDWNGNVPRRLGPFFPPCAEHYNAQFHEWVASASVEWKQTDFGGWVAKVTKDQILDFLHYTYGADPSYTDPEKALRWQGRAYLVNDLEKLTRFIRTLDPSRTYALVATEF